MKVGRSIFYFRDSTTAYFELDGIRRGYAIDDSEDVDLLIAEKLEGIRDDETKQKEGLNKKITTKDTV